MSVRKIQPPPRYALDLRILIARSNPITAKLQAAGFDEEATFIQHLVIAAGEYADWLYRIERYKEEEE